MSSVFSERSSVGGGVQLHLFNETHKWQRLCLVLIMVCGWWKRWPPILRQSNTAHNSLYIRQRQIEPRPCQSTDFRTRKIAIYCLLALHLRIIARSHDIFVVRPFMVVLVYAAVCNDIYSTFHKSARRLYLVCSTNRSEHTNTTNKKKTDKMKKWNTTCGFLSCKILVSVRLSAWTTTTRTKNRIQRREKEPIQLTAAVSFNAARHYFILFYWPFTINKLCHYLSRSNGGFWCTLPAITFGSCQFSFLSLFYSLLGYNIIINERTKLQKWFHFRLFACSSSDFIAHKIASRLFHFWYIFFSVSNFSKNVSQSFKIRLYNYKLHISHVRIVVCIYDDDAGVQSGRSVKKMKYIEMCNVVPCRFLALVRTKCSVEIWREKKKTFWAKYELHLSIEWKK